MKTFYIIALFLGAIFTMPFAVAMIKPIQNPDYYLTNFNTQRAITLTRPELNSQDAQFWQLIFKACREDTSPEALKVTLQCIKLLKAKGANFNVAYPIVFDEHTAQRLGTEGATYTPVVFAVASKKQELVDTLLDLGADVNGMCTMGSPFQAALTTGNIKILPILLARGANINLKDEWGQTALFGVLYHKEHNLFNFLYSHPDLDCTVQDNQGQTPLHYEILQANPSIDIVKKLMARGANPLVKDRLGRTAFDYAREGKFASIIAVLEGREPEVTNNFLVGTLLSSKNKQLAVKKNTRKPIAKAKKITKKISPKKRSESEVAIEQLSPTKKLRDALESFTLDSSARRALTFSDDTSSHEETIVQQAHPSKTLSNITRERLAPRVLDWFKEDYIAEQKNKSVSPNDFARSVYYHQLPLDVIQCILDHGKCEERASATRPDDIGKKFYLRGEMVFENQCDNPWLVGRKYQPGYYHCSINSQGEIYHVGFDAIKDGKQSLSDLFATQKLLFNGNTRGIQHSFTI